MAVPVGFQGATHLLSAPEGQEDEVHDLPIFRDATGVTSCWRLTDEELDEVIRTGVVWFKCAAPTHPPILVSGEALVLVLGQPAKAEPFMGKLK